MDRPTAALGGGVAGTAVLSLLLLLLEVETRSAIGIFAVIARFVGVPGRPAVGFVLFLAAGVVAWPLIFVALERYLPGGPDPARRGLVFATVLWIAFVTLGRGEIRGHLLIVYAAFTLVAHLAYGFVLGAVYAWLTGRTDHEPADRPVPGE